MVKERGIRSFSDVIIILKSWASAVDLGLIMVTLRVSLPFSWIGFLSLFPSQMQAHDIYPIIKMKPVQ